MLFLLHQPCGVGGTSVGPTCLTKTAFSTLCQSTLLFAVFGGQHAPTIIDTARSRGCGFRGRGAPTPSTPSLPLNVPQTPKSHLMIHKCPYNIFPNRPRVRLMNRSTFTSCSANAPYYMFQNVRKLTRHISIEPFNSHFNCSIV